VAEPTAAALTDEQVSRVRDDPPARWALLCRLYELPAGVDREARELAFGRPGAPRTSGTAATLDFIREPTARTWYRAHNVTIVSAYLDNENLARSEGRVERFFLNLVLMRVLYAHALVTAPRLALGWRLDRLYDWSAGELGLPGLTALLHPGPTPRLRVGPAGGRCLAPRTVPARPSGTARSLRVPAVVAAALTGPRRPATPTGQPEPELLVSHAG
jgi:hypothetical protein